VTQPTLPDATPRDPCGCPKGDGHKCEPPFGLARRSRIELQHCDLSVIRLTRQQNKRLRHCGNSNRSLTQQPEKSRRWAV